MAILERNTVAINGVQYPVAEGKNGQRLFKLTTRASQPGDPGDLVMAEWDVSGPDLNSYEEIPLGQTQGYLGRDYGAGTDGRWAGLDQLGPAVNTITLSAYDTPHSVAFLGSTLLGSTFLLGPAEVPENSHAYGEISSGGTTYGYVARGVRPGKINETTMASTAGAPLFSQPVTDIISTYSPQATTGGEVSFGLGDTAAYQVINAAGVGTTDVVAANSSNQAARTFGVAPDRIVAMATNTVSGNIIAGAVTMAAPAWNTVGTITGREGYVRLNGFAMDGSLWVISTSAGPYVLDQTGGVFFPVISEIDNNNSNGLQTGHWFPIGVVIPLTSSVRYMRGSWGKSFGPETYMGNTSPVQGMVTGFTASARWGYASVYNAQTGDTYLCALRPRQVTDPKPNEVSWYVLAKFTGTASNFLHFIGTVNGARTNETVVGGYGSNAFYITNGRTAREYQDSNYRNQTSGVTYLTELRRQAGVIKDVEVAEFETAQCGASDTVTPAVAVTTSAGATSTVTIGSAVTTNGLHRIAAASSGIPLTNVSGVRLKPQLTYAASAATSSPQTVGMFRLYYRLRQTTIRVWNFVIDMPDRTDRTSLELEAALRNAESSNGPVIFDSFDQTRTYVRVRFMTDQEIVETLGGVNSQDGIQRQVGVQLTEWTVA